MSERERDPNWDQPGHDPYANVGWNPIYDPGGGSSGGSSGGGSSSNPLIDFDQLLNSDPSVIASKAALDENVAAAKLAREAAIKRAAIALGISQADIARQSGFRTADIGASLAGRGILQSGGYGAGLSRIEEDRQRNLAAANQTQIDTVNAALTTEADLVRQFNQAFQQALAEAALRLSGDPRYRTDPEDEKPTKPPKPTGGGSKPPPDQGRAAAKPPPGQVPRGVKKRKKWLKDRERAGRM